MSLSRRQFLSTGAAAAAATLAPGRLVTALETATPAPPDLSRWSDVRAQFALSRDWLHFSSFFLASHPRPVREAIETLRRTLDANPLLTVEHGLFEATTEAENFELKVLSQIAPYLGARIEDIALVPNTTTGLALAYHGMWLAPGDEVLTTTHDHYSHHDSIRLATTRAGATMRKVTLFERSSDATAGGIVERIASSIRPETRAIGVTWVHSSTGVRLPIREIAAAVRAANQGRDPGKRALLVVDGVHGLGAADETVAEMGCDVFAAGAHKWMFAPRGTGILWATPEAWARLHPTVPTFSELSSYEGWMEGKPPSTPNNGARMSPGGFQSFEHRWAMGAAFQFHQRIGRARVAARIRDLNAQLRQGLAAMPRVRLHTPRDPGLSAGITCFEIDGIPNEAVVKRLIERRILASTSPYKVSYARLAPALVNDPGEVDQALRAVRAIAAT